MNVREEPTRIAIRLDCREPMRGVVDHHDGGQPQVFVGWLGLLKALQESFAAPESAGSPAQEGEL